MIFAKEFLEPEGDDLTDELYSVSDFLHRVNHIVETYYSFDDGTITKFVLDRDESTGIIWPIDLTLHVRSAIALDDAMLTTETYQLTAEDPLGPFNVSHAKLKSLLSKSAAMEFHFSLSSIVPTQFLSAPFRWSITIYFKNTGGIFTAQVMSTKHVENRTLLHRLGWVPIALIILSTASISLQVKATIATFQVYYRTRSAFRSIPFEKLKEVYEGLYLPGVIPRYDWKDVPFGVKTDFFGSWYGLEILGEIFLLISCFHGIFSDLGLPISDFSRVFLGCGFLIICVGFARYLEYWKKFYMLIVTMQGSFQRNLRFVISVLPLYMGFCTCGFVIFSPYSDDFSSLDKSAITLFALLNGDDIHAQFDRIYARYPYPIVGQVFLFTFIIMFITLVLNIFLFIIEDSYHAAKDFINTNAERHSRVHRRKDAGREGGGGATPRLGDIEFDLPTLFDVIEAAVEHIPKERSRHIRPRDPSLPTAVALSVASPSINGESVAYSLSEATTSSSLITGRSVGQATSSTFGGAPQAHDWGGRGNDGRSPAIQRTRSGGLNARGLPADDSQNKGLRASNSEVQRTSLDFEDPSAGPVAPVAPAPSSSLGGNGGVGAPMRSTSVSRLSGVTPKKSIRVVSFGSGTATPGASAAPVSPIAPNVAARMAPADLNSAIANTIASSQAEFLLEVDEKMKHMRERFASKLQADLEALLASAPATPSQVPFAQPAFGSAVPLAQQGSDVLSAFGTGSPVRSAVPSFVSDDEEERSEESDD